MNNFKHALFAIALFVAAAPLHAADPGALVPTTGGDVHYHNHVHGSEQPPQTWAQFGVSLAMNPKTWIVGGALGAVGWLGWQRRQARLAREERDREVRDGIAANGLAATENTRRLEGLHTVMGEQHAETIERIEAMSGTLGEHGAAIAEIRAAVMNEQTGLGALGEEMRVMRRLTTAISEDAALAKEAAQAAERSSAAAQAAAEAARDGVAELRGDLPGMFSSATENLATADAFAELAGRVDGMASDLAALRAMLEKQGAVVLPASNNSLLGAFVRASRFSFLTAPGDDASGSGDDAETGDKK